LHATRPEAAIRAHIACGANLALESVGDLREARPAKMIFPGSLGLQTRRFGGFCYFGFWSRGLAQMEPCAQRIPRAA
jgi:hypothetical protein